MPDDFIKDKELIAYFFVILLLMSLSVDMKQRIEKPRDYSGDHIQNNILVSGSTSSVLGTYLGSTFTVEVTQQGAELWSTPILDQNGNNYAIEVDFYENSF